MLVAGVRLIRDIKLNDRVRTDDVDDIEPLAKSIAAIGLMHAITIDPHNNLIAGYRRVLAFKHLGRREIPVHVVGSIADQSIALAMERTDNTEGRPMLAVDMPAYAVRLAATREFEPRKNRNAEQRTETEETRHISTMIAPELGVGKTSVQHFLRIGRAAASPDPILRSVGLMALGELRLGRGVELTSERLSARLRQAEVPVAIKRPSRGGTPKPRNSPNLKIVRPQSLELPDPDSVYVRRRREEMVMAKFQRDIIGGALTTGVSLIGALNHIADKLETYGVNEDITPDERERWLKDITRTRTALGKVFRAIKGGQHNGEVV